MKIDNDNASVSDSGISAIGVTGVIASKLEKTDDYSIETTDENKIIELTSATSTDKTFTLPSVGEDDDGLVVYCSNDSGYVLTVTPSDLDYVWNSGAGYGVELPYKGTMIALRYDHANTKWDIVYKVGGLVKIEGLVLTFQMNEHNVSASDNTANTVVVGDDKNHLVITSGGVSLVSEPNAKFPPSAFQFHGDDYAYCSDSTDWDIYGNQTGHKTVAFWVYLDGLGNAEEFVSHYEDANNWWYIYKEGDNEIAMVFVSGGGVEIYEHTGSLSATTWYHVALVIDGSDVGLYLDGDQIAYDGTWDTDTLAGNLYIGQSGASSLYLDGKMQDLHISYNNPYNADPQSDNSDSFTVPIAPFQGVMK